MTRRTRTLLWVIGLSLLVAVPVGLRVSRGGEAKSVETSVVAKRVLSPTILASGSLTYQSEVKLVSEIIGRVLQITVKEGDSVKKGQLLLQIDPATAQAAVSQLEASLAQSRLNLDRQKVNLATLEVKWARYKSLREQGMVDANTFDDLTSQRDLARVDVAAQAQVILQTEAQLKQSREALAKTALRAPIDGKVTALIIKPGETAVPSAMSIAGSDLMTVADTSSLYAEVNVNETDVARVGVGQEARIVPAAYPDKAWKGVVERVAASPRTNSGQSKTYPVRIRLTDTADLKFQTGMSCRAEIATRNTDATPTLAVPVQAVHYEETANSKDKAKASVFVVKDGRVSPREVETGVADDEYIEIIKGVQAGDTVVTGPARTLRFLRDADRVAATTAPTQASTATP